MPDTDSRNAARRAFLVHLAVFAAVNAVLVAINLLQTSGEGGVRNYWFIWPLAGWGIGIAAHGLALWLGGKAREGALVADPDIRGVGIHLFVYVTVNILLIAINLIVTPESLWFFWPLAGWGAGVAAHALLVYRAVLHRTVERYATEQRVLADIQREKQAGEIAAAVEPAKRKPAKKRTTRKKTAPAAKKGATPKAGAKRAAPAGRKPTKPRTGKTT